MISREGKLLRVTTAMTMDTVGPLLDAGLALIGSDEVEFDFSVVPEVDSAAIGLMFEWMREAQLKGGGITFTHLPKALVSLATLYGVLELIPQATFAPH